MEVLEIEPVAPRAGHVTAVIAAPLDLDDVGPPIGELADRRRSGAGMSEVEDCKAGQRQGSDAHECGPSDLRSNLRSKFTSAATLVLSLGGRQARGVPLPGDERSCPRYRVKLVNPVATVKTQDKIYDLIEKQHVNTYFRYHVLLNNSTSSFFTLITRSLTGAIVIPPV